MTIVKIYGPESALREIDKEMRKWDSDGRRRRRRKVRKKGGRKVSLAERDLASVGYNLSKPANIRRMALGKAIKKYGWKDTERKLKYIATRAKITESRKDRAKADLKWLKEYRKRR